MVNEYIKIDDIQVKSNRQRKKFTGESLGELASSIETLGLMHAVVLRSQENVLVAGERRLRAIKLLVSMGHSFLYNKETVPEGCVPVTRITAEEEASIYEAELVENLQRENLTVQEEMEAIAALHELRCSQNPKHTPRETAEELNNYEEVNSGSVSKVKDAILITKYKDNPEVKKAKTASQARKAVEKIKQSEHRAKLAEEFKKVLVSNPEQNKHVALQGDAYELLAKMPDRCVDVVCTDPPYGIDAQEFGDQTSLGHKYNDSYESWKVNMARLAMDLYRVAKKESHGYIFCAFERYDELKKTFQQAGWQTWSRPMFWFKGVSSGMLPYPEHGPRYTYECILFIIKGKKKVLKVAPDVLYHQSVARPRHAAEKPASLYKDLLERSALPGDHVLDPFSGSGPIFPAGNSCQVKVTAFELEDESFNLGLTRVNEKLEPLTKGVIADSVPLDLGSLFNEDK